MHVRRAPHTAWLPCSCPHSPVCRARVDRPSMTASSCLCAATCARSPYPARLCPHRVPVNAAPCPCTTVAQAARVRAPVVLYSILVEALTAAPLPCAASASLARRPSLVAGTPPTTELAVAHPPASCHLRVAAPCATPVPCTRVASYLAGRDARPPTCACMSASRLLSSPTHTRRTCTSKIIASSLLHQ
jgi:hypothetical protein